MRASFKKSTGEMIGMIQRIYFTFAIIVSFGVVYNSARIALSERSRDLATLRVIGFTQREVAAVLIGELALLTLAALPVGLAIGSFSRARSSTPPAPRPCGCRSCSLRTPTPQPCSS